jgi:hypothetical protein
MSWKGTLPTGQLQKVLDAAKGETTVDVEMSDPTQDTPPVAVTVSHGSTEVKADFGEAE